ncbi:uncharacterized protein [Antedon mediterranea]|uniref:uncharacterized protein n=1 Tax=Antedon mediterranea TaxID=105859 RepID=UPI003AF6E5F0
MSISEYVEDIWDKPNSCIHCGGFYGINYKEPVCSTCHAFLYPPLQVDEPPCITITGPESSSDGEDSGTEEPTDYMFKRKKLIKSRQKIILSPLTGELSDRITALSLYKQHNDVIENGIVENLPNEVLEKIFSYLDDLTMAVVPLVCQRWQQVASDHHSMDCIEWEEAVHRRWPLFKPQYQVKCWKTCFTKLLETVPCRKCIEQINIENRTNNGGIQSWRARRLKTEMKNIRMDPPEGVLAVPLTKNCIHWQASIIGPPDSPYEGGIFYLHLQLASSYPIKPPIVHFMTKIFHPNISCHGDVGIDSLHHNWSLALTITKVLISVQSLLTDPFTKVCMEPTIGALYENNREEFNRIAQDWTWRYAMMDMVRPDEFNEIKTQSDSDENDESHEMMYYRKYCTHRRPIKPFDPMELLISEDNVIGNAGGPAD